jgi:hypothetical protein
MSPSGAIVGTPAVLAYFTAALARYPTLTFRLHAVFRGIDSVTLLYERTVLLAAPNHATGARCRTRLWC